MTGKRLAECPARHPDQGFCCFHPASVFDHVSISHFEIFLRIFKVNPLAEFDIFHSLCLAIEDDIAVAVNPTGARITNQYVL
jgi:hypothetical protein